MNCPWESVCVVSSPSTPEFKVVFEDQGPTRDGFPTAQVCLVHDGAPIDCKIVPRILQSQTDAPLERR